MEGIIKFFVFLIATVAVLKAGHFLIKFTKEEKNNRMKIRELDRILNKNKKEEE